MDGGRAVAFDRDEAECLLDLVVRRWPAAERTVEHQDKVIRLLEGQVKTATTALSESERERARDHAWGQEGWKQYDAEVTRSRSLVNQPIFWALLGAAIGGGAVALGAWAAGG